MPFTNQTNTNILNHVFRNQPYTSPDKVYVGLFTSANTEVSGGGYTRKEITFGAPFADGNGMKIANDAEVRFPIGTADWGEITHAGIFDAETGGTRLDISTAEAVRLVRENDQLYIAAGNYKIKLGGEVVG